MKLSYSVIKPEQYQDFSIERELENRTGEIATKAVVWAIGYS
jgi:hypothetical protein